MEEGMSDKSGKDSHWEARHELVRESVKLIAEGLKLLDALASLLLRVL